MKKRWICLSLAIIILFTTGVGRLAYIVFSKNYAASDTYNSYALTLESIYPELHYSNGDPMGTASEKYVAVLKPNERTIADLHNLFSSEQINSITEELKNGYPLIKQVSSEKKDNSKYIRVYKTKDNSYISKQLISAQSSGFMSYIHSCGERKISFHTDALGRMLRGDEGRVYEEYKSDIRGYKLTIDKDVEKIAYEASSGLGSGCIVIMDVRTSGILACISKPDMTYINKPFAQYSAGSVFKIIVACCALENEIDFYYNCEGKTKVGDTEFSCQKNHIHGFENLESALSDSCNCYFVNLALKLGKEKLLETAEKLGFNQDIKLYNEWKLPSARIPEENELNSKGELALFGFGQGKLTVSPIQMCYCLCTIANNGNKNPIKLVSSVEYENGNSEKLVYEAEKRAISSKSSKTLLDYLRNVVVNGTGKNAESKSRKSAGKTATAQTGQFVLGREILNTWFAGVYPCDYPEYAIVVMKEDGISGSEDCAPIYREIVEKVKIV